MSSPEGDPHFETITDAGPTAQWLTLVHGASQHMGLFSAQVAAFRARYRLLLIDLPGHGGSARMPGPYGYVEHAAAVERAIDLAGVTRTHYWGTHTGAAAALLLAVRMPRRFLSLTLDGAVLPGVEVPSVAIAIGRAKTTVLARGLAAARDEWFETAAWFDVIRRHPDACRAAEHRALIDAFGGGPWTSLMTPAPVAPVHDALARLDLPVLLVNGEHDLPDFIAMAGVLAQRLPTVRRVVVPGGGGFPLWEFPAVVNPIVAEFLAARPSPRPE
jgi:pimeloyl-ACP methyl ester carboxylesterase